MLLSHLVKYFNKIDNRLARVVKGFKGIRPSPATRSVAAEFPATSIAKCYREIQYRFPVTAFGHINFP